jgi:hypothetical protein
MKIQFFYTKLIIGAILLLAMSGCYNEKTQIQRPDNLLDKDKMVAILTEVQLVEAAISMLPLNHVDAVTRFKKHESEIFAKHSVDSLTYFTSYQYYAADGKALQYLYLIVSDSIQARKTRAENLARIDSTKRADSVMRALADSIAKKAIIEKVK